MIASVPYDRPEDLCKAVKGVPELRVRLGELSARPWNMYEPQETSWWLVPRHDTGSWPAHHLGKFVFEFGDASDTLDVGLYVEKGVSEQAAEVLEYPGRLVLTADWMWSRFIADLRAGVVTNVARRISAATVLDVRLVFFLGPQVSSGSPAQDRDQVSFAVTGEGPLVASLDPRSSRLLSAFSGVKSETELVHALERVDGFTWIDAYIGATFACARGPAGPQWTAEQVWADLLAPLGRWVG